MAGVSQQDIANRMMAAQGLQQAQQAALGTQLQAAGGLGSVQAQEPRRHPPDKLVASPDAIKVGGIGLEQILIKGSLLKEKQYRFPLHCWGDGMFIVRVVQENIDNTIFCPEINVWFNYFEPGRWDK